jgi:hypothetical protein
MNRRELLKSLGVMAGAALVPSWLIPTPRPSHGIDLTAFCAPAWRQHKYSIDLPFVQQGVVDEPDQRAH